MKSPFELWLENNQQELIDFYYEGTCIDRNMLTAIEEFAEKAWNDGYREGYNTVGYSNV